LFVTAAAVIGVLKLNRSPGIPEGVSEAEYQQAETLLEKRFHRLPEHYDVLSALGEKALSEERRDVALACFQAIPTPFLSQGLAARLHCGEIFVDQNLTRAAQAEFRDFLKYAPRNRPASRENLQEGYKWLTYLLSVELRLEERQVLLQEMHAAGLANLFDSKQLYFPHLLLWATDTGRTPLTKFLANDPQDFQLRTAFGRYETYEGHRDKARGMLEECYRENPQDLSVIAALLECCFEFDDWQEFSRIASAMPAYSENEPWLLKRMRGEQALHDGQWEEAIRNFQRTLKSDPTNPWSQMGLARAYGELGREADREAALHRSVLLSQIRVSLSKVTENDPAACRELVSTCEQIDYPEAAEAFRKHAERIEKNQLHRPQALIKPY
jgi:tetratricopeptide (TPR) repeat protein